ncbi:MAG TPA: CPBP family intramembrane glutamic endopeptidase [Opitutales bacterium]|jgi:membrane protease YdiL (CAAX protease family)|nr:CPBP family intramembrane glutamic endopeptidase [Opitutales bacterium]
MLAAVQAAPATNVPAIAVETVWVLGGLTALVWQVKRARREPPAGVTPWRTTWLDFGIWIWIVACSVYLGVNILRLVQPSGAGAQATGLDVLLNSVAQISALAALLILLRLKKPFSPAPVNHASLPLPRALKEGALALLAACPIIFLASELWADALILAQHIWPSLQTPLQDTVTLLSQSSSISAKALLVFFAVLVAPATEELFFRAGIYRFLKSRLPAGWAAIVASLIFALTHVNLEQFLPLFVLGMLLVWLYERTGNVRAPILFHAFFNLSMILVILLFPDAVVTAHPTP